jgi:hypothetical protein
MRALGSATLHVAYISVVAAVTTSCSALLGTEHPVPADATADDAAALTDAPEATAVTPSDSGGDALDVQDVAADGIAAASDAAADAAPIVCPDSCPHGGCVLSTCPVRIMGSLQRTVAVFADPGTTGSVFFADFDTSTVYHYDKATGAVGSYPPSSGSPVVIAANSTDVYWSLWNHTIGTATRSTGATREVQDTSYGVSWYVPWSVRLDTSYIYWCNRYRPDCWRMDLGLKTPTLLYEELLPDGGASPEELTGIIAVDPGPGGYVFFTAGEHLNRMNKDGSGLIAFAPVHGQGIVGVHEGNVYWVDPAGAMLSAPEDTVPSCDAGACGEVIVSAATFYVGGPLAFDDTYAYWYYSSANSSSLLLRARLDGNSPVPEILVRHTSISSVAVDDLAIYYTTQNDNGVNYTGSFWRQAK